MAFAFGKKKKKDKQSTHAETGVPEQGAPAPRRAKDALANVIDETEPEAALDLIKENTAFLLPDGTGVILALPVDAPVDQGGLGGLGPASSKSNEAKGSILERITADKIQVLETADMLDRNILGIIPTSTTLGSEGMDEYTLFDKAVFMLVGVRRGEDGGLLVQPLTDFYDGIDSDKAVVSFRQAQDIAFGVTTLRERLPHLWADQDETLDETVSDSPAAVPSPAEPGTPSEPEWDVDDVPDLPMDDELPTGDYMGEDSEDDIVDPFADLPPAADATDTIDDTQVSDETSVDPESTVEDDRVYDVSAVRETMARRFLDEDLALTIDMSLFESVIGQEARTPLTFGTDHLGDGWLDNQMRVFVQQANDELAALRQQHVDDARRQYVSLISRSGDEISAGVSILPGDDTVWAQTLTEMEENRKTVQDQVAEVVAAERRAEEARYEKERQKYIDAEAVQAATRYDDRHRAQLERALGDLEPRHIARIDDEYQTMRRTVLDQRRTTAQTSYDAAVTHVVNHLIEAHQANIEQEAALMTRLRDQMQAFLDENRKEDIARSQALSEELARHNVVEAERAAHAERVKELHEAIRREQDQARRNVETAQREAATVLDGVRKDYEAKLSEARSQVALANDRVSDMTTQVDYVRATTAQQFEAQITALESDKMALIAQIERESVSARRSYRLYIALAVLVALAFLAVGVITGILVHDAQTPATMLPSDMVVPYLSPDGLG